MNANRSFLVSAALAVSVLGGCAAYDGSSLRPGASTEADARSLMGPPALDIPGSDGARHLAYPRGPLGTQTHMVDLGRDGVVRGVRQALTDDTFNRIRPGMTKDQVLALIGPPGDTMHFARMGQTAWDYRYRDTWGYTAIFSVMIDGNGIVRGKMSQRLERDRRD